MKERKVKAKQITFHRKKNLQYYDISAKSNYNFEKPFLWLARKVRGRYAISDRSRRSHFLMKFAPFLAETRRPKTHVTTTLFGCIAQLVGDPNLTFVESPALKPPEVVIDTQVTILHRPHRTNPATSTALGADGRRPTDRVLCSCFISRKSRQLTSPRRARLLFSPLACFAFHLFCFCRSRRSTSRSCSTPRLRRCPTRTRTCRLLVRRNSGIHCKTALTS